MIFDLHRLPAPAAARILEATHQFLFLRINADDRLGLTDKALALSGNVTELPVTVRTGGTGKLFAITAQSNAQLIE
jgi:hypothetical protein